jgi:D-lactate dehydrogenase
VGIIGYGGIGQAFGRIMRAMGAELLVYSRHRRPELEDANTHYVSLDELYARSDVISLHCPLTDENRHMVNAASIAKMKKGVVLLNTSRGALIDTEALVEGIKLRKVGAACLDVYEEESNVFFHDYSNHIVNDDMLARLISMPNVIVTSHQAFLTQEALANIADSTLDNVKSFFEEGFSSNEICYKCDRLDSCNQEHKKKCF